MTDIIKWIGTVILLIGVTLTAVNIYPLNIMIMLVATSFLMYVSVIQKDRQYAIINAVVLAINSAALLAYCL